MKRSVLFLQLFVPVLWLGFVSAISLMEAPLKFQAPSVDLAIGVDIGKLVFSALNRVEWVFFLIAFSSIMLSKNNRKPFVLGVVLCSILLIQTYYLLPILDERAALVIARKPVEESNMHFYYVGLELIKITLLFLLTLVNFKAVTLKPVSK